MLFPVPFCPVILIVTAPLSVRFALLAWSMPEPSSMSDARTRPPRGGVPLNYLLREIDPVLWRRVKVRAAQEGVPIRTVLLRLLRRYVAGRAP